MDIFPEDKKWFDGQPGLYKVVMACIAIICFALLDNIFQTGMSRLAGEDITGFWFYVRGAIFVCLPFAVVSLTGFIAVSELFPDMPENPSG